MTPRTLSSDARSLPPPTRAHLFECMRARSSPAPIFVAHTGGGGARARAFLALAALGALGIAVLATCTSASAPSLAHVVAHVALGAIAASAAVSAVVAWRAGPGGGAAPGVYVFPFELVDARTRRVRVHSLDGARDVRVRSRDPERGGATIEAELADGSIVTIVLAERAIADELRRAIVAASARIARLGVEREEIAAVEAIRDGVDEAPQTLRSARWVAPPRFVVAAAMTCALVLGPAAGAALFSYAKTVNDDLRFARANAHPSEASYAEYLATGGGRYEAEVRRTLLPCAELRGVVAASPSIHDYVPFARFVEKYPASYCTADAKRILADKVEGVRVAYAAP